MNLKTGESSKDLFGGDVPEEVRRLIEAAKQAPRESAAPILWTAQALSPSALPTYYLLYKLHAGCGELEEAERAARLGLRESALQAGLPADLGEPQRLDVPVVDFGSPGPARFWLFTIKALAFISVRKGNVELARRLVDFAARCDPSHSTGSEVTAMLVAAAEAEVRTPRA
jgi:hypothetical protein